MLYSRRAYGGKEHITQARGAGENIAVVSCHEFTGDSSINGNWSTLEYVPYYSMWT